MSKYIYKFTIYGAEYCEWCKKAKVFCIENGINHDYIDISDSLTAREYLLQKAVKTIPLVEIRDSITGELLHSSGYTGMIEWMRDKT